jgi:hypothetical protein
MDGFCQYIQCMEIIRLQNTTYTYGLHHSSNKYNWILEIMELQNYKLNRMLEEILKNINDLIKWELDITTRSAQITQCCSNREVLDSLHYKSLTDPWGLR